MDQAHGLSFDTVVAILLLAEAIDAVCGFKFSSVCRALHNIFGPMSLDHRLSEHGQYLRMILQHKEKLVRSKLSPKNIPLSFLIKHQLIDEIPQDQRDARISEWFCLKYPHSVNLAHLSVNLSISIDTIFRVGRMQYVDREVIFKLLSRRKLAPEFIRENKYNLFWPLLCRNPHVPHAVFSENIDLVNWYGLCENPNPPLELLLQHPEKIVWSELSKNPGVPLSFIEQHKDRVNWYRVSERRDLTENFLRANEDSIVWSQIRAPAPNDLAAKQPNNLSLESLRENIKDLNWSEISRNPSVPISFLRENSDKIDWAEFSSRPYPMTPGI
jgi:hypothetical protein